MHLARKYRAAHAKAFKKKYSCQACGFTDEASLLGVGLAQGHSPHFLDNSKNSARAKLGAQEDLKNAKLMLRLCSYLKCSAGDISPFRAPGILTLIGSALGLGMLGATKFLTLFLLLFLYFPSSGCSKQPVDKDMERLPFTLGEFGTAVHENFASTQLKEATAIFLGREGAAWTWALWEKTNAGKRWHKIKFIPQTKTIKKMTDAALVPSYSSWASLPAIPASQVVVSGLIEFSGPLRGLFRKANAQLSFYEQVGEERNYFLEIEALENGHKVLWTLTPLPDFSRDCPPVYEHLCQSDSYQKLKTQALKMKID